MNDSLVGSLWLDRARQEFIILLERQRHDQDLFWEWRVWIFKASRGFTTDQISTNSRTFMNENAFVSPESVFDMERIA